MSGSPILNRSFLHGDIKRESTKKSCENIVYATLDCLALKRTRLPLQLVPVHSNDSHDSIKTYKIDGDKKSSTNNRKASSRRPSFKVSHTTFALNFFFFPLKIVSFNLNFWIINLLW